MKRINITKACMLCVLILCVVSGVNSQAFIDNTLDAAPPLPVKLLSFAAKKINEDIAVSWTTASERSNSHFNIERSLNGADFKTIGKVSGKGTSSTNVSYAYTDLNTPNVLLYYRLQQVDIDGKTTLSPIVLVKSARASSKSLAIFPNPAKNNTVSVSFEDMPIGLYSISIVGMNGANIYQRTIDLRTPTEIRQLYMENKPVAGLYIVRITNATETFQQKLIVE